MGGTTLLLATGSKIASPPPSASQIQPTTIAFSFYSIVKVHFDLRFSIYDFRFSIYDFRFTIYDFRFTMQLDFSRWLNLCKLG
ncbi:hypothetical protein MNBD_CHLOROFLEXI01-4563 [hydrothermal vent metagenome]|uniref:Uncharacterized protein n=1 Tax=hydrothermal vent metagenome TaxID=652676 RepID=A0A3B0VIG0_9ZZZZ